MSSEPSPVAEEKEVARLARERDEALEQQTATSEVLDVISASPGELVVVFQAMLERAVRLCEAKFGNIYRWDGEALHILASHNTPPAFVEAVRRSPYRPYPNSPIGRMVADGTVTHINDVTAEEVYVAQRDPMATSAVALGGIRTLLGVPLLNKSKMIGAFFLSRQEVRPFTDKQIALVKSFAAQAVIAIENTRLLNELRQRTTDLTEALEQQTASSDVLRVISSSPGELEPVFDAMLESATRICEATFGAMLLRDGDAYRRVALHNAPQKFSEYSNKTPILRPGIAPGVDRVIDTKRVVHIRDLKAENPNEPIVKFGGARTILGVPMLKENEAIGVIGIYRQEVRPFTDKQIELVKNFAAQAVIARASATGRAALEGRPIHIPDVLADPEYGASGHQLAAGHRTTLAVPLLREGTTIGVFGLLRDEVNPFTEKQIALVQSFAAQAVIAIENARLLNELKQSLEQQTATANVLDVISRSAFDLQAVFKTVAESSVRLCGADRAFIFRFDGELLRMVVAFNSSPEFEAWIAQHPIGPGRQSASARAALERSTIHIVDVQADPEFTYGAEDFEAVRTVLAVPILKGAHLLGVMILNRLEVRPFSDQQIALVETFADQAAIAIENGRLLEELRERTEQVEKLNEQLEQRVADQVGEIERMGRLRRFLPPQVADLIVASGTEKQLESHRREITALFCDLRGFTGFTESADAEDVMALLRDYHAAIGEIIIKYNGTLERYAGDGVMVVFNDPVPVESPALQAVLMALELRDAIGALMATWSRLGHDIGFGIGIAHGFATLGTIGFEGRFDYAAIGTVSNVASRLCDEAKPGQILISPRVLTKVENAVTVEPVGEFTLKGIRRPLAAYNVVAATSVQT